MNDNLEVGLKNLIEQTYMIEQEYKNLYASYENLQKIIKDVVDVLPTAIWILNSDETLFLQNAQASKNNKLFNQLDLNEAEYEIEFEAKFYLVKISNKDDKKIISAIDITSQKRNERLASMGQVAAHLAHEIRNPIGSISLLSSTLLKRVDDKNSFIVKEMQSAIWRVERIIKATLLFTKGVHINRQPFNFLDLKKDCEDALKYYDYSKEIDIRLDFQKSFYNADKELLSLVFQNLLFNAIDAIEDDENDSGEIKIWYEKTDEEHRFYMYDSGVSIADKRIVFEPFKTTKLKGNGLGLSLCLQIIQAHKGSIEISLNPKTFCVSLPIYF
ncbi:sensor histidine kinase [Campylobacter pinnipediorum]|uniref:sensor histidine kinase n=1 Tax=Campylobacter pinnipediorum TaxID=1965231 RepID=UPI00099555A2|nr:ATP-binding protein [Campylobacter pinnipediorum]AQW82704.1 two-component system, sensor histidine kinase [Campylobacter pinnipediorum subsp. pinnipediorum]